MMLASVAEMRIVYRCDVTFVVHEHVDGNAWVLLFELWYGRQGDGRIYAVHV